MAHEPLLEYQQAKDAYTAAVAHESDAYSQWMSAKQRSEDAAARFKALGLAAIKQVQDDIAVPPPKRARVELSAPSLRRAPAATLDAFLQPAAAVSVEDISDEDEDESADDVDAAPDTAAFAPKDPVVVAFFRSVKADAGPLPTTLSALSPLLFLARGTNEAMTTLLRTQIPNKGVHPRDCHVVFGLIRRTWGNTASFTKRTWKVVDKELRELGLEPHAASLTFKSEGKCIVREIKFKPDDAQGIESFLCAYLSEYAKTELPPKERFQWTSRLHLAPFDALPSRAR